MENMEIENVVEEVIENVQEVLPTPVADNAGMTMAKTVGVAAVVYGAFEGGKWAIGKIRNWAKKRKAKKESKGEDVMEAKLVIDEDEK